MQVLKPVQPHAALESYHTLPNLPESHEDISDPHFHLREPEKVFLWLQSALGFPFPDPRILCYLEKPRFGHFLEDVKVKKTLV